MRLRHLLALASPALADPPAGLDAKVESPTADFSYDYLRPVGGK